MATAPLDRDAILRIIESWPIEEQVTLARAILEHAARPAHGSSGAPTRSTWDALYGIASSGQEPLSDEEVAQWLDERKLEKCGH